MSISHRFGAALLSLLLLAPVAISPALAQSQQVQGTVRETHGAWDVVCDEGRGICAMRQVGKNAEGSDVLVVTVRPLTDVTAENGEQVPAVINIVAPLGVALRAGVRVTVDGGQERAAPFDLCLQNGCVVQSPMGNDFLADMKRGSTAAMKIVAPRQGDVVVNISLQGFTRAFNAL